MAHQFGSATLEGAADHFDQQVECLGGPLDGHVIPVFGNDYACPSRHAMPAPGAKVTKNAITDTPAPERNHRVHHRYVLGRLREKIWYLYVRPEILA